MLSWISWNPSREVVHIPIIDHPITWYGIILAVGCMIGYRVLVTLYQQYFINIPSQKTNSENCTQRHIEEFCERLSIYSLIGILLGARLGHILFYENIPHYLSCPWQIFMIWEGGISSHGVILGAAIAMIYYRYQIRHFNNISFTQLTDLLVIPLAIGMAFVRVGNFINQEAVGVYTTLPWGVVFDNPFGAIGGIPRHPVQIYEALIYIGLFYWLYKLYRKNISLLSPGKITGLFLHIGFTMRFFLEYLKEDLFYYFHLNMGQWLSIPYILVGGFLLILQKNFLTIKNK